MKSDCLQVAGATVFEFFVGYMIDCLGWCRVGGLRVRLLALGESIKQGG